MPNPGPTSFFDQQDMARRNSRRLIWFFGLAVLAVVVALDLLAVWLYMAASKNKRAGDGQMQISAPPLSDQNLRDLYMLIGATSIGTGTIIGLASLGKTVSLASGGSVVAEALGGRLIDPLDVRDPLEKRLLNVVEEMAIASGVPVPPVYMMDNEEGINAFAAGHRPTDAVIGVTRGTLQTLSRDQLQGVIAHEFSHILNGDMRLNIRMMGVLYGLLFLGMLGRTILRILSDVSYHSGGGRSSSSDGDSKDNKGNPMAFVFIIAIALFVLGYLGFFLGRLIQAALSRQREFLADASAVQFTRNPDGIAGALKAIGGWANHAQMKSPEALETAHLFFGDAIKRVMAGSPLATHPPLETRIRRLDPHWDGVYPEPKQIQDSARESARKPEPKRNPLNIPGMPNIPGGMAIPPIVAGLAEGAAGGAMIAPVRNIRQSVDESLDTAGRPGDEQIGYARSFLDSLPDDVSELTHQPLSASCLVLWLLRPNAIDIQAMPDVIRAEYPRVARNMPETLRDYPVDLCKLMAPAIRRLTASQMESLLAEAERLIMADDKVKISEWLVRRLVTNQLRRSSDPAAKGLYTSTTGGAMPDRASAIALLLSALAWSGQDSGTAEQLQAQANAAIAEAADSLAAVVPTAPKQAMPRALINADRLDAALARLSGESAKVRLAVIRAAAATISADEKVTRREFDMVRVVADSLDCPLPPIAVA